MKLSDAMLLGSTMGEPLSNKNYDCCLIGQACHAMGMRNHGNDAGVLMWPWILEKKYLHPLINLPYSWYGTMIISSLCQRVLDGLMTLEEAVEWVKSVEPAEAAAEQPQEAVPELAECAK